jgi:hypothetical protein
MMEAKFRRAFERALRSHTPLLEHMASMHRAGVPDEYLLDGRSYWLELKAVEVKTKSEDANVLEHRFSGPQIAFLRRVDRAGGRGLGVVGFPDPWRCIVLRVHDIGDGGTLSRREIARHRQMVLDAWFHIRFLTTLTRS